MILHSGGAIGADTWFAKMASINNIDVYIHSFQGHSIKELTKTSKIIIHTNDLDKAMEAITDANKQLQRHIPLNKYVLNLILRDYFQICNSQYVFAVSTLINERIVKGGTGWAIEMSIERKIPIVLFDDFQKKWFYFSYKNMSFKQTNSNPPKGFLPSLNLLNITGIGSRNISNDGIAAIKSLFFL